MSQKRLIASLLSQNAVLKAELDNLRAMQVAKEVSEAAAPDAEEPDNEILGRIASLFRYYDSDQSGFIDRDEFELLVADLGEIQDEAELTANLASIDASGDGKISLDEFSTWYQNPDRSRASEKGGLQLTMMKLKLNAKLLAIKVAESQTKVAAKEALLADDEKINYQVAVKIGDFVEPGMTLEFKLRAAPQGEVGDIMREYGTDDTCPQLLAVDLYCKDGVSQAEAQELADAVSGLLVMAEGSIPPFVTLCPSVVMSGATALVRVAAVFKQGSPVVPIPAASIALLREFEFTPATYAFGHNFAHFVSNPDAKLADVFKVKVDGHIKWTRATAELVAGMVPPPINEIFKMFGGVLLSIQLGDVRRTLENMQDQLTELKPMLEMMNASRPASEVLLASSYSSGDEMSSSDEMSALIASPNDGEDDDAGSSSSMEQFEKSLKLLLMGQPEMAGFLSQLHAKLDLEQLPPPVRPAVTLALQRLAGVHQVRVLSESGYDATVNFLGCDVFSLLAGHPAAAK